MRIARITHRFRALDHEQFWLAIAARAKGEQSRPRGRAAPPVADHARPLGQRRNQVRHERMRSQFAKVSAC